MPKVVITNDLEPGMLLHSPVSNNFGQILIGANFELSQKHIFMLKTWNIQTVTIQSEDTEEELLINNVQLEEFKVKLIEILGWKPRNKNEEDLIELGAIALSHKYKY